MPPYVSKIGKFHFRKNMAIFDYDWTIARPISNGTFSKSVDDWRWLTDIVPDVITKFYNKGFCIIIISNQTKNTEMKINQISNALSTLSIPSLLVVGYEKNDKKPKTTMFDIITKDKKVDMTKSFYVGDALGRQGDWSAVDREFADNIKIKNIYSPDELFSIKQNEGLLLVA